MPRIDVSKVLEKVVNNVAVDNQEIIRMCTEIMNYRHMETKVRNDIQGMLDKIDRV